MNTATSFSHRFAGRVALVTGGASGIGRAVVDRLVEEQGRVIVWDVQVPGWKTAVPRTARPCWPNRWM